MPDHKRYFTELMDSLGFIRKEIVSGEYHIPEEYKDLILERIDNSSPEKMDDWEIFKKELEEE